MGLIMAAAVVVNVVIGEGRIGNISARLRQWGLPVGVKTASQASKDNDGQKS